MAITRVTTDGITDSAVSTAKIGANAVDTTKIGADVIVADDIADNAITVAQIQDGAITSAKLNSAALNPLTLDTSNNRLGVNQTLPQVTFHSSTTDGGDYAGYFHNGAASGNGTALVARGGANNSGAGTFMVQDYGGNEDFKVDGLGRVTMPNQPSFMARGHGGGAYNNSAATLTPTNVIDHNIGNCYNTSNGYFTAPVAGRYIYGYGLGIIYATASSGTMYPYIRKNGTTLHYQYNQWSSSSLADYQSISASIIVNLAAGDYLTVTISTNGNAQWYMDSSETYVYGMLLG